MTLSGVHEWRREARRGIIWAGQSRLLHRRNDTDACGVKLYDGEHIRGSGGGWSRRVRFDKLTVYKDIRRVLAVWDEREGRT